MINNDATADVGTVKYSIGTDDTTEPTTNWSDSLPTGKYEGTYYVWYKSVVSDPNYLDSLADCISVYIAPQTLNFSWWPNYVHEYTGSAIEPVINIGTRHITFTCAGGQLQNSDFAYEYEDNTDVGTAKVKISLVPSAGNSSYLHNYTIDQTNPVEFIINPITVTPSLDIPTPYEYTGSAHTPSISWTDLIGGQTFTSDDYEVTYNNNIAAGTDTASASISLKSTGSVAKNYVLATSPTVLNFSIGKATLTPSIDPSSYEYTGSAITPTVILSGSQNTEQLVLDTDYEVSYSNNTDVGDASATITLKSTDLANNYLLSTGSLTFSITKLQTELSANDDDISVIISSSAQNKDFEATTFTKGSGTIKYEIVSQPSDNYFSIGSDTTPTITIKENTPVNDYTVNMKASYEGDSNKEAASATFTLTIHVVDKELNTLELLENTKTMYVNETLDLASLIKPGTAIGALSYEIVTAPTSGEEGTITGASYKAGVGVVGQDDDRTAKIAIKAAGNATHSEGTEFLTITIKKYDQTITFDNTTDTIKVDDTFDASASISTSGDAGAITYSLDATTYATLSGNTVTGTHFSNNSLTTLTASAASTTTAKAASLTRTFKVTKGENTTFTVTTPQTLSANYSESSQELTPSTAPTGNIGTVTYEEVSGTDSGNNFTVDSSTGKITAKAGLESGDYTYQVNVSDDNGNDYEVKTFVVTYTISISANPSSYDSDAILYSSLEFNNTDQLLIQTAGSAIGGEYQYAVSSTNTTPDLASFTSDHLSIKVKNVGTYYVWKRIKGDANHSNKDPELLGQVIVNKSATMPYSDPTTQHECEANYYEPAGDDYHTIISPNTISYPSYPGMTFTYELTHSNFIIDNNTGAIKVKDGTAVGSYTLSITITSAENDNYLSHTSTLSLLVHIVTASPSAPTNPTNNSSQTPSNHVEEVVPEDEPVIVQEKKKEPEVSNIQYVLPKEITPSDNAKYSGIEIIPSVSAIVVVSTCISLVYFFIRRLYIKTKNDY